MMLKPKRKTDCRRLTVQMVTFVQALLVMFAGTAASAQEGNRLQDIQVQSLSGQRVELKLIMSETAPSRWRSRSRIPRASRWTCRERLSA
jgi:hypothetical protein